MVLEVEAAFWLMVQDVLVPGVHFTKVIGGKLGRFHVQHKACELCEPFYHQPECKFQ